MRGANPRPMPLEDAVPLTREAVLGGLPARRASMLLFAIESRTARLVVRARREMAPALVENTAAARERAFLQAVAEGRDLPMRPTIQDLERHASQWADLVPREPRLRAALAHLLGRKYTFNQQHVPAVRRALGLDDEAVEAAHQHAYSQPVRAIFAPAVGWREQVRWRWARLAQRLERLPPFWTVFALTLTETIGAGTLAVPIAAAGIGPLAGVALLAVVGLVNVLTVAALAEAFARNGAVRYGGAFFGRLTADYLAGAGSGVLSVALLAFSLASLLVYYVGVATTLAGVAGVPAVVWAVLLLGAGLAVLRSDALDATVAAALLIGAVNIGLILAMTVLALPYVSVGRLVALNLPLAGEGQPGLATLGPALGVSLAAYFGHTSIGNCAQVVLRRDASGRALIAGAVAATLVALVVYSVWVIAVNGAVPADALRSQAGTALGPLAAVAGPVVSMMGAVYVVLGMGMASLHVSRAVSLKVREWMPAVGGRGWLASMPVVATFLLVEWLLWQGRASFAATLAFAGALKVPLLGGVFPLLLLVASRRKGEYVPRLVIHWLDHPFVVGGLYVLFVASVLLHAGVIWQDPVQRLAGLLVGLAMLGVPLRCLRRRAFNSRVIVELRADLHALGATTFSIVGHGRPLPAEVRLAYPDGEQRIVAASGQVAACATLESAAFAVPATGAREVKVWAHTVTPDGDSRSLPARLEVDGGGLAKEVDLGPSSGQVVLPLRPTGCEIRLVMRGAQAGVA